MDYLSEIPAEKAAIIEQLLTQLQRIKGIAAIVLGGSYAAGTAHADSDLDIGLYYNQDHPFAIMIYKA